jgi:hypothetical protein
MVSYTTLRYPTLAPLRRIALLLRYPTLAPLRRITLLLRFPTLAPLRRVAPARPCRAVGGPAAARLEDPPGAEAGRRAGRMLATVVPHEQYSLDEIVERDI